MVGKIANETGKGVGTYNYTIGNGHVNGIVVKTDNADTTKMTVIYRGEKTKILFNSLELSRLAKISDFFNGVNAKVNQTLLYNMQQDDAIATGTVYTDKLKTDLPFIGNDNATMYDYIYVPLGSLYLVNGNELNIQIEVGTADTDFALYEVSDVEVPAYLLTLDYLTDSNTTLTNVNHVLAFRSAFNKSVDFQITSTNDAKVTDFEGANIAFNLMGKVESYFDLEVGLLYSNIQADNIHVKVMGANAADIDLIAIRKEYINSQIVASQRIIKQRRAAKRLSVAKYQINAAESNQNNLSF